MMLRLALIVALSFFTACGSCNDVDKKGDPFKTTEDAGDAGRDSGSDVGGDVGRPDMGNPTDMPGQPTIVLDRDALQFVDVPVGSSAEQTFTVLNAGTAPLELSDVTVVETVTGDAGVEFEAGSQWTTSTVLQPDASTTFSVRYTPLDDEADEGYVQITANDPALADGFVRVSLRSALGVPDIAVTPAVTFGRVPPVDANSRDQYWEVFEVRNIGGAPLELADIVLTPIGSPFSYSFPPTVDAPPSADSATPQPAIDPGESMPMRVFFNPIDTLPAMGALILFTDDPDSPETIVDLIGNSGSPCIELSEETQLDFGTGAIGFTSNRTLIIENCSNTVPLQITDFDVCTNTSNTCASGGVFGINVGTLGASGMIPPGDTATLVVSFSPIDLVVSTGMLTVSSDDPAKPMFEVPLRGEGTDGNACPQAVADGRAVGMTTYSANINAIPLQTIELRGTNSTDPDGTVASYEWTILQRPNGSTTVLTPSGDVASPQLFLDLAGTYLLELQVTDDDNAVSCGTQAIVRIDARPDQDLHVQLVWDTPTDSNQTDANGTDLDLHFLHPNGDWNNAPWDIYWLNPTAEWGVAGPNDDPSLDIDDTNGAGPENINLSDPQAGITYAIGAYYYSDNGYGPSYATLRIYVRGMLEYEHRDQYLATTSSFWYAATISWPSGGVFAVNQVSTGFP